MNKLSELLKILGAFFILCSCSLLQGDKNFWNQKILKEESGLSNTLLEEHQKEISSSFNKNSDASIIPFSKFSSDYFKNLLSELKTLDENLFSDFDENEVSFYYIKDLRPMYFSLPGKNIYLSKGVLKKYIEHESFLKSIFLYEMIRIQKKVYRKVKLMPKGFYSLSLILNMNRLPLETKHKLNEWTYSLLERGNLDSGSYIQWLQIMNSYVDDFSYFLGGKESVIREEKVFKDFLIKYYGKKVSLLEASTSSKKFYLFKRRI